MTLPTLFLCFAISFSIVFDGTSPQLCRCVVFVAIVKPLLIFRFIIFLLSMFFNAIKFLFWLQNFVLLFFYNLIWIHDHNLIIKMVPVLIIS